MYGPDRLLKISAADCTTAGRGAWSRIWSQN